MQIYVR